MNQSNLLNLFVWLVIDKKLRYKLKLFFKQIILFKRDPIKSLVAIFKLTELIGCQTFKIFFQLKTSWCIFIFHDKINYFLFGQISLNLWQSRPFNLGLLWIVFFTEFKQLISLFFKLKNLAEIIDEFFFLLRIFKEINYFVFKFLKIIFIKT